MRRLFIAGNWKMNTTSQKARDLVAGICGQLKGQSVDAIDIAVCPPFPYLASICELIQQQHKNGSSTNIQVGAQNMHWQQEGAFTGEVSAPMLCDVGCRYVILGHSERRTIFRESNQEVNKKVHAALQCGLLPIVCIGETLEEREQDATFKVIEEQLLGSLADLSPAQIEACTLAYEPVWAIGTGKTASPEMAQEVHRFIRGYLARYGESVARSVRIQYGGSVKPDNVQELLGQEDIDGALVGGASLQVESFANIIILANKGK